MKDQPFATHPPAVVLGLSATGLAVGRMLAPRGVRVYGLDREFGEIAQYSRHITRPPFGYRSDGQKLVGDLTALAQELGVRPVLIPAADYYIDLVVSHAYELRPHYRFSSSLTPAIAADFLNKRNFYRVCERHGVSFPRTRYLEGRETADEMLAFFRLPVIVKPNLIHLWKQHLHGRKVVLIETPEDMRRVFDEQRAMLAESMVQEVIPGPESDIYIFKGYFAEETGRCVADFVGRKLRQCPPMFGSGSFAVATENEDVRRLSVSFLEKYGFRGLCGTEYKFDRRDGQYKMIEVNIRPQLWEDLTRVAHREVVWSAYCDLAGLPVEPLPPTCDGATWAYLLRDAVSAVYFMRRGELRFWPWLAGYRGLATDAVFDWRDPLVSVMAPINTLRQVGGYLWGRKHA